MMDNRIFNVNGRGLPMLAEALKLAFIQEGFEDDPSMAEGWVVKPDNGLILLWHVEPDNIKANKFPVKLTAEQIAPMVFSWLSSKEAKNIRCEGWDANADHDGENVYGWRVYVEDWGSVGNESSAICAIRPSYNWLGK